MMAGLWNPPNEWTELPTFAIVTTEPPEDYIHDRIPVMLGDDEGAAWMSNDAPVAGLKALLTHCPTSWLAVEDAGPVEYRPKNGKPPKADKKSKGQTDSLF